MDERQFELLMEKLEEIRSDLAKEEYHEDQPNEVDKLKRLIRSWRQVLATAGPHGLTGSGWTKLITEMEQVSYNSVT